MKKIITIASLLFLAVICIIGITFLLGKKEVTVTLTKDNFAVKIYSRSGSEIQEIKQSSAIRLSKNTYSYSVVGEGYDAKFTPFTVEGDMELIIKPRYLTSYIPKLTETERPSIEKLISSTYPVAENVSITEFTIDPTATWGYGKLTVNNNPLDIYRFILKRTDKSWSITVKPAIAIQKDDVKDIPEEIVYSLY